MVVLLTEIIIIYSLPKTNFMVSYDFVINHTKKLSFCVIIHSSFNIGAHIAEVNVAIHLLRPAVTVSKMSAFQYLVFKQFNCWEVPNSYGFATSWLSCFIITKVQATTNFVTVDSYRFIMEKDTTACYMSVAYFGLIDVIKSATIVNPITAYLSFCYTVGVTTVTPKVCLANN